MKEVKECGSSEESSSAQNVYDIVDIMVEKSKDITDHEKYVMSGAQPEIFQSRGGFVKLGHFDKHFIKKSRKKAPQGKMLEFFS